MKVSRRKILVSSLLLLLLWIESFSLCFAQSQDSWAYKPSMQMMRSGLAAVAFNGEVFAIGGVTSSGFCSYNEMFDPVSGNWSYRAPMPTPRSSFAITELNKKIYCIGGYYSYSTGSSTDVNEVYDPVSDSWQVKSPMIVPTCGIQANVANNKLYVIGGKTNGTVTQVYDPINDTWTLGAPPLKSANACASTAIGDKIYVISTNFTQVFDTESNSWTIAAPPPLPVVLASAISTTGKFAPQRIYVFGADAQLPFWQLTTKGFVTQIYDTQSNTWTVGTPMIVGRYDVGVAEINDLIYTIGGFTTQFNAKNASPNPTYIYAATNLLYQPIGYRTTAASPSYSGNGISKNASPLVKTGNATASVWQITTLAVVSPAILAIVGIILHKKKNQLSQR